MNQEGMLKPVLIGGVLLGVLSALPIINLFNCFCCAWVIAGGMLAANLYVKSSPVPVTLGNGVVVGLLAGIVGGVVHAVFSAPVLLLSRRMGWGTSEQLSRLLEELPNLPPETRDALRSVFSSDMHIGIMFFVFGALMTTIAYAIVAMVGGAIGVAVFEKRKPGSGFGPPASYPPPMEIPPPPPPPSVGQ